MTISPDRTLDHARAAPWPLAGRPVLADARRGGCGGDRRRRRRDRRRAASPRGGAHRDGRRGAGPGRRTRRDGRHQGASGRPRRALAACGAGQLVALAEAAAKTCAGPRSTAISSFAAGPGGAPSGRRSTGPSRRRTGRWRSRPAPPRTGRSRRRCRRWSLGRRVAAIYGLVSGRPLDEVSLHDFASMDYADNLFVAGGLGAYLARLAHGLPVRLGAEATAVDWSGAGVGIGTTAGTVRARAAIVTAPIAVLQGGGIRFTPALPAAIEEAVHGFTAGVYEHVVLHWPHSPLRGADRLAGLIGTRREPPGLLTCIDGTPFHFFELDQPGAAAFDGRALRGGGALRPRGAGRAFRASRARWPLGAVRHRLAARSVRARLLGGRPRGFSRSATGSRSRRRADLVCGRRCRARNGARPAGPGSRASGRRRTSPALDAPPAGVSGPAGGATACSAARGPAGGGRP